MGSDDIRTTARDNARPIWGGRNTGKNSRIANRVPTAHEMAMDPAERERLYQEALASKVAARAKKK